MEDVCIVIRAGFERAPTHKAFGVSAFFFAQCAWAPPPQMEVGCSCLWNNDGSAVKTCSFELWKSFKKNIGLLCRLGPPSGTGRSASKDSAGWRDNAGYSSEEPTGESGKSVSKLVSLKHLVGSDARADWLRLFGHQAVNSQTAGW